MNVNRDKIVLSLYDYTGEALKPWAEAGYTCLAFDIQHDNTVTEVYGSGGSIKYVKADLHDYVTMVELRYTYKKAMEVLVMTLIRTLISPCQNLVTKKLKLLPL